MPEPTAPGTPAAATPATEPTAQPDLTAKAAQLERELAELKSREGRFRNEKGVMQARIRELEQLALGNSTGDPEPGNGQTQPTYTPPGGYGYAPPQQDVVTREEWDLDRFRRENSDKFDSVRQIALDAAKVGQFIRYRQDQYGRAIPDVYGTYSAIAKELELEDLRKKVATP